MQNTAIKKENKLFKFASNNSAMLIFIALFIFASLQYDNFFNFRFIMNLFAQNSMIGFIAIGMTFVIITGNIDISVGSTMAMCAIVAAWLSSYPVIVPILGALLTGAAIGLLNGLLVVRLRIVPFIATLSTMIGIRGIIHIITNSKSVPATDCTEAFKFISKGKIIPNVYNMIIWFIIALIIGMIILKYTRFGRHVYATGGNLEAARMMSINVDRVQIMSFVICGITCAFAGLLLASKLRAGQYSAGQGWEMYAIAATVIGGTLLTGGKGKLIGTFFSVLILGIIAQILNLQGSLSPWWQSIITGAILLTVVIMQSRTNRIKK